MSIFTKLQKELGNRILRDEPLARYTTFKIGGPAKYFYVAKNEKELVKAVLAARKFNTPYFILGGGGNILVSDNGFEGMVIKMQGVRCKVQGRRIVAEAGVLLKDLVKLSVENELTGLEWAAGIPGTAGGAILGNAGAFGGEISQVVESAKILDESTVKELNSKECQFEYRNSVFKRNPNLIILSVEFSLKKGDKEKSESLINDYISRRKSTQPLEYPSAGCTFRNPPHNSQDKSKSAGALIEELGLKGKQIGGAKVSEKHANFIVNVGGAKAEDVIILISLIKQKIRGHFGIQMREEIRYVGF